jgi:radical SAM superfamily enzyme YgiQ (UPF0313 family)
MEPTRFVKNIHPDRTQPKALLIYPPVYDFALYDLYFKPYGLLKIAQWLGQYGWNVDVVNALSYTDAEMVRRYGPVKRKSDGTGKFFKQRVDTPVPLAGTPQRFSRYGIDRDLLEKRVREVNADVVFISTGMTYWYPGIQEVSQAVKSHSQGTPIIAGGIYATLLPDHCQETGGVDHVIVGDPWIKLGVLLKNLGYPASKTTEGTEVAVDSTVRSGPDSAIGPLITEKTVREAWRDAGVLQLNRGCPFSCSYCASKKLYHGFSPGNPKKTFADLTSFYRFGITNFAFYDDALLVDKEKVLQPFLRNVIDARIPVRFYLPNAVHLQYIDRETARLMKHAGFQEVRIGFESAAPEFHAEHDQKIDITQVEKKVRLLKDAGFKRDQIIVYILAGLPGQEAREVEESIRFAACNKVRVSIAEYSPVPGTELWERSVEESRYPIAEEPLFHNNTFFPMEWDRFTREDLERLKRLSRELSG